MFHGWPATAGPTSPERLVPPGSAKGQTSIRIRSRKGSGLDELAAAASPVGPVPNDGHQRALCMRRRRACGSNRPGGRARSPGGAPRSTPAGAAAPVTWCSILSRSVCAVHPNRPASRAIWVSTTMPGFLNAPPSTRSAVSQPTPGRLRAPQECQELPRRSDRSTPGRGR
jgi:hypothetical protein